MRFTKSFLITTPAELTEIAAAWERLWRACPDATPFQSPAWLLPWWEHLGHGDLRVYAIEDRGELVALAPFHVSENSSLQLMGAGISDYLDALCLPSFGSDLLAQIDPPAELRQLSRSSPLYAHDCSPDEPCPVLDLAAIPKRMTQNVHYYTRRAEREGALSWETADQSNVAGLVEALIALHAAAWQSRGTSGVLADPKIEAFHRAAAPRLLNAGLLRMYGLRLRGRLIGVWYGFFHRQRLYFYLGGFSPEHRRLSPGTLLIAHAIEQARRDCAVCLDFLRGEEPYKCLWGARSQTTYQRYLYPRTSPDWTHTRPHATLSPKDDYA